MFHIKYAFQKDGPLYSCEYPPSKDINNNIFIIKGRNDKGKSTVLQMIALGLYGLEAKDIDKTLRDKMQRLLSPSARCEFEFKILSNDRKTGIECAVREGKQQVKINDAIKNKTYVEENLKIIFDVPDDPTKKLASALSSIEHTFHQYDDFARQYVSDIDRTINRIEDWENKSSRLKEEKQNLEELDRGIQQIKGRLGEVNEKFEWLEKCRIVIEYNRFAEGYNKLEKENKELEKRIKSLKAAGLGGGNKGYRELISQFREALLKLKSVLSESKAVGHFLCDKDKRILTKTSKEIESLITPNDLSDEKLRKWYDFYNGVLSALEANPLSKKKLAEEDEIRLVEKLIEILRDFVDITAVVPGTNGKDVNAFIKELEVSRDNLKAKISEKLELKKATEKCSEILQYLGDIAIPYKQIPKREENDPASLDSYTKQQKDNEGKMGDILKKIGTLEEHVAAIPEHQRIILLSSGYDEKEYLNKKDEKTALDKKYKDFNTKKEAKKELIKDLEKTVEPPKGFNKDELRNQYHIVSAISRKLNSWVGYTTSLNMADLSISGSKDEEARKFYDALGEYFAEVLKHIYFENRSWIVSKVDLLNNCYVVENRKPINFIDIGTGHNQLNACMARLKQNYGGRKKIVLFDELTVMDANNIKILIEEIKKQVKDGDVLLALLTQADNNYNDVVIEPVKL